MSKSYKLVIRDYQEKYGDIPFDHDDIMKYLDDKLKLTEDDYNQINKDNEYAKSIPWEELQIILPIVPKPSPRPRYSRVSHGFYVEGAAENKKLLKYYIEEIYNIIYTQTYFSLVAYLPTPMSVMSKKEIYRAEQGDIRPLPNPDWDNLGKTYSDMIQQILIFNDNIITKGLVEKYYSVKPRVEINIKYQKGFDSKYNKNRILNSSAYKKYIEVGNVIQVYTEEGEGFW